MSCALKSDNGPYCGSFYSLSWDSEGALILKIRSLRFWEMFRYYFLHGNFLPLIFSAYTSEILIRMLDLPEQSVFTCCPFFFFLIFFVLLFETFSQLYSNTSFEFLIISFVHF